MSKIDAPAGLDYLPVATHDLKAIAEAFTDNTRMVWVETPSNPLLRVIDIAAVAQLVHQHDAVLVVDNTFATPYLQQPLALGADAVVHSTTKYLGGHSDVVGGFVATSDEDLASRLAFVQNSAGAVPGPFDSFLVLRGVKTLAVRMDRHCTNAATVVELFAAIRPSTRSITQVSRRTRAMTSPLARCGASAA